jgi:hypothetical protein
MARGDVINGVAFVSTPAYLNYQPAAGVEVMITLALLSRTVGAPVDISVCLNGDYDKLIFSANTTADVAPELNMRLFINNTNYFSIYNASSTEKNLGYSGIQTK